NACTLCDHAERREGRADAAMQADCGFHDATPGFRLLLSAALEGVASGHAIFAAQACVFIIDKRVQFQYTHMYHEIARKSTGGRRFNRLFHAEKRMETKISEIADGISRLSTYVPDIAPPAGFTFNQFLVLGDEPLMFHTGLRKMFHLNRDALTR